MHVLAYGLELRDVEAMLITHSHDDHLYPLDFEYRKLGYAYFDVDVEDLTPIPIHSSPLAGRSIVEQIEKSGLEKCNAFKWVEVTEFVPFETLGYTVTPLVADHAEATGPRMYIISKGAHTMLYGHDSGWYPDCTWEYLEKTKPMFDFVSLDCTGILKNYKRGHMGIEGCEETRARFLDMGIADGHTIFCLHHFSHNGELTYDELKALADTKGFEVSYDTAEFEF